PALEAAGFHHVRRTARIRARAGLVRIAHIPRAGPAHRGGRLENIRRTGLGGDSGATLRRVAHSGRSPALENAGFHHVGRTARTRTRAGLVRIAPIPRAGPAHRGGRLENIRRAGLGGDSGATLRRVAHSRRRPALEAARFYHVGRTARTRARAGLVRSEERRVGEPARRGGPLEAHRRT